MRRQPHRPVASERHRAALASVLGLVAVLTLPPAGQGAGTPASTGLRFSNLPARAVAGQSVTVAVARARAGARCALAVSYGPSSGQDGLEPTIAVHGGASWSWKIPDTIQANRAKLTVNCAGSKRISTSLLVVGSLIPPRMSVVKDGWSVRTSSLGTDASYGVIIRNHSPNADALHVNVLVNFVLANDHLLGSASTTIPVIPAGTDYNLGGNLGFPGAAPVARLEVVIQVGATDRHNARAPALDNIVIEPSGYDPGWVGDVAGELINNDPHLLLSSVQYSAVILDPAGNVLGGGTGSSYGASLPPGTRVVFKLTSGGLRDIPIEKAATVQISATPTWQPSAT